MKNNYWFQTDSFIKVLRQLEQYLPLSILFALLAVLFVFLIFEGRIRGMD
jgi:hypothetical protein